MSGLTDQAGGETPQINQSVQQAHLAWEASMQRQLENLRQEIAAQPAALVAQRSGAFFREGALHLTYWGQPIRIEWPEIQPVFAASGNPCSVYDSSLLLYYLRIADGAPLADRWVAFRELPSGGFYHQAFQGYSGDRLSRSLGEHPDLYVQAAQSLGGMQLTGLSGLAYTFRPLPRFPLAALLWPGDDEFPSRASILFDANACNYMILDGCALLGSGLVSRLIKAQKRS